MSSTFRRLDREADGRVPKVLGADVELANSVLGLHTADGTGRIASRLLLERIHGVPQFASYGGWSGGWNSATATATGQQARSDGSSYRAGPQPTQGRQDTRDTYGSNGAQSAGAAQRCAAGSTQSAGGYRSSGSYNLQDWGRKFLPTNGGCCYIDLWHLEVCIPEVLSALDYLAALHAMLLVARQAMNEANAQLGTGRRVQVLANNSDGLGNSYGGHLNCLVARRTWDDIFYQFRPTSLGYLASFQVSSMVFAGQGKVGSENGRAWVPYQLSQRADFFETVVGLQTTIDRPLVNSRDEALCGTWRAGTAAGARRPDYARLHCIFYDTNLCHVANVLKAGTMQMVLAMMEAGWVDSRLVLDRPLDAVVRLSHDPSLKTRCRMADGRRLTGVELQLCFLEQMQAFHQLGGFEGVVPRAGEILALYADTLEKLRTGEFDALAGRLDWVLKLRLLQRARAQQPNLRWNSERMKLLDHLYSSLDPHEGLYWIAERAGLVDRLVRPGRIEQLVHQPPADTRAFARAMLLRTTRAEEFSRVDWDSISFRLRGRRNWWTYRTLDMPDPLGMNRTQTEHLFAAGLSLDELIDALASAGSTAEMAEAVPDDSDTAGRQQTPATRAGPSDESPPGGTYTTNPPDPAAGSGTKGETCATTEMVPAAGDVEETGHAVVDRPAAETPDRPADECTEPRSDEAIGRSAASSNATSADDSTGDGADEMSGLSGPRGSKSESASFHPHSNKGGDSHGPASTTRPDTTSGRGPSRR